MPTLNIDLQVGGPSKVVHSNPKNDLEQDAPVLGPQAFHTAIEWPLSAGGIVSQSLSPATGPLQGADCTFAPVSAGTVTGQIQAHALDNTLVTYDLVVTVAPAPLNILTHFAPTVETV